MTLTYRYSFENGVAVIGEIRNALQEEGFDHAKPDVTTPSFNEACVH